MKRLILTTLVLAVAAMPALAQTARRPGALEFASDFQTIPVMGNTPGAFGATFQTYVALLNPTASAFTIQASLWDANGTGHDASITLAAGDPAAGLAKGVEVNDKDFLPRFPFLAPAHPGLLQGHGGTNVPTQPTPPNPALQP